MLEATTLADEIARLGRSRDLLPGPERTAHFAAGRPFARRRSSGWTRRASSTLAATLPEWLSTYNRAQPIDEDAQPKWLAWGPASTCRRCATLTYDAQHPEEFFALYQSSPFAPGCAIRVTAQTADRRKTGTRRDTLDFVFVSLGSMALLGYETGSDSPLMDQMALQLDLQIQTTLETLNKAPGKEQLQPDLRRRAWRAAGTRSGAAFPEGDLREKASRAPSTKHFPIGSIKAPARNTYVDKYVYPFLYLKLDALRKQNIAADGPRANWPARPPCACPAWRATTRRMATARTPASGGGDSKTVSTSCVPAT